MRSPAQPEWTQELIKAALRDRFGQTLAATSVEWGYSPAGISHVLRRRDYSRTLELKIAEALGVSAHVLWPSRWSADGKALSAVEHQTIQTRRSRASRNAVAA